MLRITKIEPEPFHTLGYRTAGPKGKPIHVQLPFHRAEAEGLPSSVQALVLTSDLQGRETGPQNRLLGCALADELVALHNKGIIPRPNLIALCGDLYEYPDCHKRGGTGPVDEVFFALGGVCDQVVGVLGNHDELARRDTVHAPNISILDGTRDSVLGLRIGGLSGIIGDPKRHLRRSEDDFLKRLESLTTVSEMSLTDYAESWAWTHWLLETTPVRRALLCDYLARLRTTGAAGPLSQALGSQEAVSTRALQGHLQLLVDRVGVEHWQ